MTEPTTLSQEAKQHPNADDPRLALPLSQRIEMSDDIQQRVANGDQTVTDRDIHFCLSTFADMNEARISAPSKTKGTRKSAKPKVDISDDIMDL